jgi:hypothetical protein
MIPIENRSPFAADIVSVLDKTGSERRTLVVVATFEWDERHQVRVAATQTPVCLADEYRGEPGLSSVQRESDVCPPKPFVDILVNAFAYAPAGRRVQSVKVAMKVGDVVKQLRVTGDRPKRGGIVGEPQPFDKLEISYERAGGGTVADSTQFDSSNPVGIGFRGARAADPRIRSDVPNVEHLEPARGAPAAGFGVIGRGWTPRLQLAGTYDEAWLASQWPLPPDDFDERHYQSAPPDQQSKAIRGGERVQLLNLTPEGHCEFVLPTVTVPVYRIRDAGAALLPTRLDTLYIWPERRQMTLCHRAAVESATGVNDVREIVVGHMTGAWLHARCTRRYYIDPGDTRGEIREATYFS